MVLKSLHADLCSCFPLHRRTKTSGRTSENSFVCTTSFLQTEELAFLFQDVNSSVHKRDSAEGNNPWVFSSHTQHCHYRFFLLLLNLHRKLCLNQESWMFVFNSNQTWNKRRTSEWSLTVFNTQFGLTKVNVMVSVLMDLVGFSLTSKGQSNLYLPVNMCT